MKINKFLTSAITLLAISPIMSLATTLNHEPINDYFKTLNTEIVKSEEFVNWTQFGSGNAGYSEAVFIHPTDPNVVFNFPDMFNSYRSTDGGSTWLSVMDEDYRSLYNDQVSRVYSVDFSRQDENFGMAATVMGMFITYDKGASWNRIEVDTNLVRDPLAYITVEKASLSAVGVDPNNDKIWYAGSGAFWDIKANYVDWNSPHGSKGKNAGKYFKSIDGGKTWTQISNSQSGLPDKAEYGGFYINPQDSNIVFAHTSYGLYKSTDSGLTYKKLEGIEAENGTDRDLVRDMKLIVNPANKQVELYAINQIRYEPNEETGSVDSIGGIVKSIDLGETWIDITGNLGLDFNALNEEIITNSAITNAGHKTNFVNMWLYSNGRALGKYFKGASFFKNGAEFRKVYPNIPTNLIQGFDRIVVDPTNPDNIYISHNSSHAASMFIGDVWMTKDGGQTWTIATRIGEGWSLSSEFWNASGKILADTDLSKPNVTSHHMQRDYYEELYSTQSARDLDIDSEGNVFAMFRALTKSTDGGQTWNQTDVLYTSSGSMTGTGASNLPGSQILAHPTDPDHMFFVSGENKFFELDSKAHPEVDGRATVNHVYDSPHSPMSLAYSPSDPSIMFMLVMRQAHQGEVLKSVDGGYTWNTHSTDVYKTSNTNNTVWATPIAIDSNNENNMYFGIPISTPHGNSGTIGSGDRHVVGLYKSTDGGLSWNFSGDKESAIGKGLPDEASIYTLKFDPKTNYLFAGLNAGYTITNVKNRSFAGNTSSWTVSGNVKVSKGVLESFEALDISGTGSISQIVGGLKPNTKYSFTLSTKIETAGETAKLFVETHTGEPMNSATVKSTMMTAAEVIFTTGENQTSVNLGLKKLEGTGHLYADTAMLKPAGGLYVSKDGGLNFQEVAIPKEIAHVNDVEFIADKLYLAAGDMYGSIESGGIWVQENGQWRKIFEMPHTAVLKIDKNNPNRMMVTVKRSQMNWDFLNHGVYLSEDGGQTWSKINIGIGSSTQISDLEFDSQNEDLLWLTHHGSGFFKGEINREKAPK